eukprot:CAMPEP_0194085752 /NCGR_PEP_ID=MMETSP0149-20130528/18637_1 /TAXON_ID=122233 /ORGANISM="Chaetoceros debilis, Strain MM31A-1" /LENGTH=259 /DNA_ID=CAMNT_0038768705 /DNA_START=91 /DNA_END=870 /DNA_ORIENTATION=-
MRVFVFLTLALASSPSLAFTVSRLEEKWVSHPASLSLNRSKKKISYNPLSKSAPNRRYHTNIFADNKEAKKRASFQKDIGEKLSLDRYEDFGPLTPIAETIDGLTGEWALSYADLSPETPQTMAGRAFLATNAFYAAAGIILAMNGDWFFGGLTELAGVVSFWYHYSQLEFGQDRTEVRLALLVDYFTAGAALITGGFYMIDLGISVVPFDALVSGGAGILALSLCWVWEFGYPYLLLHSIWHILSAYTGYLVGQAHLA